MATQKSNNKYENISEAEWYDYVTGLVAPLQAMQVADNFSDKDKFGKDLLEVVLVLYGIGVQQYETTGSGKGDSKVPEKIVIHEVQQDNEKNLNFENDSKKNNVFQDKKDFRERNWHLDRIK